MSKACLMLGGFKSFLRPGHHSVDPRVRRMPDAGTRCGVGILRCLKRTAVSTRGRDVHRLGDRSGGVDRAPPSAVARYSTAPGRQTIPITETILTCKTETPPRESRFQNRKSNLLACASLCFIRVAWRSCTSLAYYNPRQEVACIASRPDCAAALNHREPAAP